MSSLDYVILGVVLIVFLGLIIIVAVQAHASDDRDK